jgi:hypothetical protein
MVSEPSDPRTGAGVYLVRLLYDQSPRLDHARWATDTASRFGGAVERMGDEGDTTGDDAIAVMFPTELITFTEGSLPMQVWMMREGPGGTAEFDEDLQQTWDWPDAGEAVAGAPVAIAVSDLMASSIEPARRLRVFMAALAGLITQAPPRAIQWWPAQRIVDPAAFLRDVAEDPQAFSTAVNVRNFSIAEGDDESVMDTMGMAKLGLPDIQVHFRGRDLDDMAGTILGTARYLFDNGDLIEDGHTVGVERWVARHEVALIDPERDVLDLDTGDIAR